MKKFLIGSAAILVYMLSPWTAFASVTFDPASPQIVGTVVTPTCSVGNTIEIYYNGAWYTEMGGACDGVTNFSLVAPRPLLATEYQIVEWNSLVQMSDPTTNTLSETEADPAFVSVSNYIFTGTTNFIPNPVGFHEQLNSVCADQNTPDTVRLYKNSNVVPPDVMFAEIPCGPYTFSDNFNPIDFTGDVIFKTCEVNPNVYPDYETHYADCIANQAGIGSILTVQPAYNNTVQNTGPVGWNIMFAISGLFGLLSILMAAF